MSNLYNEKLDKSFSNITQPIFDKLDLKLHLNKGHPLYIIKDVIYNYFKSQDKFDKLQTFDELPNIVSVEDNFDLLLIPKSHPSRKKTDTYYVNEQYVLRTHTSAHQNELLKLGHTQFLVSGDVYRKDEIDSSHFNVFHQMEGVYIIPNASQKEVEVNLKETLSGLVEYLFPSCEYRFNEDYFPFTEPSFEIEVKFNNKWLEILGCGVIHRTILDNNNIQHNGWAFGFGLERLAMILFDIPDIRLFWTSDERFINQYISKEYDTIEKVHMMKFIPYPTLKSISADVSFWIPKDQLEIQNETLDKKNEFTWKYINDFYELVSSICDTNIESVKLFSKFYHEKKDLYSHSFKLIFSPNMDLNNPAEFFDTVHHNYMTSFTKRIEDELKVTLR